MKVTDQPFAVLTHGSVQRALSSTMVQLALPAVQFALVTAFGHGVGLQFVA